MTMQIFSPAYNRGITVTFKLRFMKVQLNVDCSIEFSLDLVSQKIFYVATMFHLPEERFSELSNEHEYEDFQFQVSRVPNLGPIYSLCWMY